MMNRQQSIDDRRNRIEARLTATAVATDAELDSSLLHYANGAAVPLAIISKAAVAMPEAAEAAEMLRHGRRAEFVRLAPHPDIERIFHTERATLAAVPVPELVGQLWPGAQLAKSRGGMGWGNYPIVPGGSNAEGCKVTWKAADGIIKRSIIPTSPYHAGIIRKCNQILAEAETTNLFVVTVATAVAGQCRERWRKRPSVRWFAMPQALGQVILIHNQADEGGRELSELTEGYGKAQLYDTVQGWTDNKPGAARARGCSGWGKRYQLAKGHNEESRAAAEESATAVATAVAEGSSTTARFSLTCIASPQTVASALNSTVDSGGRGLDIVLSIANEVQTLIDLALAKPLTEARYNQLNRAEQVLIPVLGTYKDTNTMSLKRENKPAPSPFPSLQDSITQRLWDTWEAMASEMASEAGAMVTA